MTTLYDADVLEIATKRGYDHKAHQKALAEKNEDQIALTHPANWLTEFEFEVCTALDSMLEQKLIERLPTK